MVYFLLFLVGLCSSFLQGSIGFGAAVVMINVIPLLLTPGQTVVITQGACIIFPLYIVFRSWRKIREDVLLPLLIPSLICTVIATRVSVGLDTGTMRLLLGILFVLLSVYFMFVADRISIRPTKLNAAIAGAVSGILGGAFVAGGPPAVLYLAPALGDDREEYVVTTQMYFIALNVMSFLTRVFSSAVDAADIPYMAALTLGALAGVFAGTKMMKNIDAALLRRFIYAFVGINGVVMIIGEI